MTNLPFSRVWLRNLLGLWLCLSLCFELVFYGFSYYHSSQLNQQMLEEIKLRVSMDLASNQVAGEVHSLNTATLNTYIQSLNKYLDNQAWPLAIKNIRFNASALPQTQDILILPSGGYLQYQYSRASWHQHLSVFPLVAALLFSVLISWYPLNTATATEQTAQAKRNKLPPPQRDPALKVLKIDLHTRSLSHIQSGNGSEMANKPLCFYLALIQYCSTRYDVFLSPNKDLPPELLQLCETYFQRMTELGHAVRKRPDFNKNLEKTLSEIRASLDQVFVDDQDQKILFYPRKAIGEGSRSKVHNYAPPQLNKDQIEIIGL